MVTESFDVAVAGSLHLDIMIQGSPLPLPDETVFGQSWSTKCGGKGGNQAKAAARFGARTRFIGCVGDDDFGERLRADLVAAGVDVSAIATDPSHGSGMSAAIVSTDGSYGASVVSGANAFLPIATLTHMPAKLLLLQNEIPASLNHHAAMAAKRSDAMVLLNAAPWREPDASLLPLIDVLILNRVEAEQSGGLAASDTLRIVLTKGADGVEVRDRGQVTHIAPHKVRQISSHGAGDLFCGALAAQLTGGSDLVTAARFANAAAALYVSQPSGTALRTADVLDLIGA